MDCTVRWVVMLNRSKVHISVEVRIGLRRRGVAGPADLLPVGLVTDLPQVHQHRHHTAADNAIYTDTFPCQCLKKILLHYWSLKVFFIFMKFMRLNLNFELKR